MSLITSQININKTTAIKINLQPTDSISNEIRSKAKKVYGVTFINEKLVLIYNSKRNIWGFPGGTIEENETIEEALTREMIEEAQIQVSKAIFLGYVWTEDTQDSLQLFFFVKGNQLGEFIADPDEGVTENRYIELSEWSKYLPWKEVGEYLIERSRELQKTIE